MGISPDTPPDDTVTVEAATAEKALEEVTGLLGADAEILRADKVQRGGIGGFFAREVVQLTARRRSGTSVSAEHPASSGPGAPAGAAPSTSGTPVAGPPATEPAPQPAAPVQGDGRSGIPDPFAEALSRFLSEGADEPETDLPASSLLATASPAPSRHTPLPALPSRDEASTSAPVACGHVRPFDRAVLEAALSSVPATPSSPANPATTPVPAAPAPPANPAAVPATQGRPEAADQQARTATATPATVVLDAPNAPAPISDPAPGRHSTVPAGTGLPDWSPEGLLRLGLPVSLVRPMIEHPPSTDAAWIDAVSASVARFCGPLAEEPQLLVGPRAHLLAGPLGLPRVDYPDTPPATGSAIIALHVPTAELGLVLRLLGDRRLHLVAGGESWERLESLRPSLVSWVGNEALAAALAFCVRQGLTLGYGRAGAGGPTFHATPLDVALALRDLVGRR